MLYITTSRIWLSMSLILGNDIFTNIICNSHFKSADADLSARWIRATDITELFPTNNNIQELLEQNSTLEFLASFLNHFQRTTIHGQLQRCPFVILCSFSFNIIFPNDPALESDCCLPCRCDYPYCMETRSCCPDIIPESYFQTNKGSFLHLESLKCIPLMAHQRNGLGRSKRGSVYMFTDCPLDTEVEMRKKCEETYTYDGVNTLDDVVPVSDNLTGYTYRNRFCALCSGTALSDIVIWKTNFNCEIQTNEFYSPKSLKQRVFLDDTCQLHFKAPEEHFELKPCSDTSDVVSFCNITGNWITYDPYVERQCELYSSYIPVKSDFLNGTYYQNTFCGTCNGETKWSYICEFQSMAPAKSFSFSGLLETQDGMKEEANNESIIDCHHEVYNPFTGSCDSIHCPILHVYNGGKCKATVDTYSTVPLEIFFQFKLTPDSHVSLHSFYGRTSGAFLRYSVLTVLDRQKKNEISNHYLCERNYQFVTENKRGPDNTGNVQDNEVHSFIVREVVIASMSPFVIAGYFNKLLDLELELHRQVVVAELTILTNYLEVQSIKNFFNKYTEDVEVSHDNNSIAIVSQNVVYPSFGNLCNAVNNGNSLPFTVNQIKNCSFIKISNQWLTWSKTDDGIFFNSVNFTVNDNYLVYNEISNGSIYICKEKFKELSDVYVKLPKMPQEYSNEFSIEELVSMACVVFSLLSLIVTVSVYAVFPELRTLPGKNTMMLAVYIAVAQTIYLVASFGSLEQGSISCIANGIALHFSWLFVIAWMFVCTYHIARVLMSFQVARETHRTQLLLLYHVFALLFSMTLVGLNIVLSGNEYNWSSIGYGAPFCYISDSTMQRYTFWLPVLVILSGNLGIFVVTVAFVRRNKIADLRSNTNRNYLLIFTKLSSLTGISWLFGFLYTWFKIPAFSYLFIILNASIGVILMLSFIMSGRTLEMLKTKVWRSSTSLSLPDS